MTEVREFYYSADDIASLLREDLKRRELATNSDGVTYTISIGCSREFRGVQMTVRRNHDKS